MTVEKEYFTEMPPAASVGYIWRISWTNQAPLARLWTPLIIAYLLTLRLLGQRFPAIWGVSPSVSIAYDAIDNLSNEIRDDIATPQKELEGNGFHSLYYVTPAYIGNRRQCNIFMLSSDGRIYAMILWLKITGPESSKTAIHTGFCTVLMDGNVLVTNVAEQKHFDPKKQLPQYQILNLPPDTTLREQLSAHWQRINDTTEPPTQFSAETLKDYLSRGRIETFNFLISKGFLTKLTSAEVDRLRDEWGEYP